MGCTASADLEKLIEQYRRGFIAVHERAYNVCCVDLAGLGWDDAAFRVALEAVVYAAKHCKLEGGEKSYLDYGFRNASDAVTSEVKAAKLMELNPKLVGWSFDRSLMEGY